MFAKLPINEIESLYVRLEEDVIHYTVHTRHNHTAYLVNSVEEAVSFALPLLGNIQKHILIRNLHNSIIKELTQ